ncbi:Diels-Alderase cheD [Cladobotryum mycophilum]|uniref:Diels-Alderase cheD n=1 Tax=Cladobotryum mycophilum TaxID=491253 RepID=A0ABR0SWY0_9HYPO
MRITITSLALLSLGSLATAWEYHWPGEWDDKWPVDSEASTTEGCTVSHLDAYEMEKGRKPVFFSTDGLHDPEAPKMLPLNSTGGEQWEFDGVSDDGLLAFCFGFYRDPNYAILGAGNLRLSAEFSRLNETRFVRVDYPSSSTVESCPWGTRGLWKSDDYSYTFEVSKDMKWSRIGVNTDDLKGSLVMKSLIPPRMPDGSTYPSETAKTEVVPYFHWVEPVPAADVWVDMQIEGKPYKWSGIGGHERLWTAFSWFTCLHQMTALRVKAGPYAASHVSFVSAFDKSIYRPSTILTKDGEVVFSSTNHEESTKDDYAILSKTYGGKIAGNLKDKVTGFELVLVSPASKDQWSFSMTNENVGFEYMLGEGVGGTGYSGRVVGGPIGLKQYFGPAFAEALEFPKRSYLFKPNYVDPVPKGKDEL